MKLATKTWARQGSLGYALRSGAGRRGRVALFGWFLLLLCGGLFIAPANAELILSDNNAEVKIDPLSDMGMDEWKVDGKNYLYQQWFWYRIGDTDAETSLNALPHTTPVVSDSNGDGNDDTASVTYTDPRGLSIAITYTLTGGEAQSGYSSVNESINLTNTNPRSSTPLGVHFFQYSDFDLTPKASADDTVTFDSTYHVAQTAPGIGIGEAVVLPFPSRHEPGIYHATLDKLTDAGPSDLARTTVDLTDTATGDATWAFQWDLTLRGKQTVIVSKVKQLQIAPETVPEPSTLALVFAGIAAVVCAWRRKSAQ